MPSASSRGLRAARTVWVVSLCVAFNLLISNRDSAGGDDSRSSPPASPLSATISAKKADPPQDIEDRFRRLEAVVSKQAEQIRQLSEENRKLAGQIRGRSAASSDPRVTPAQTDAASTPPLPSPAVPGGAGRRFRRPITRTCVHRPAGVGIRRSGFRRYPFALFKPDGCR